MAADSCPSFGGNRLFGAACFVHSTVLSSPLDGGDWPPVAAADGIGPTPNGIGPTPNGITVQSQLPWNNNTAIFGHLCSNQTVGPGWLQRFYQVRQCT